MTDMQGKVAIVTGAAHGLGQAYAIHWPSMAHRLSREMCAIVRGDRLKKAKAAIASGQSLQRNLETDDLVGTVLYLLSDASRFVSGQNIMVDGGTHFL
ncbi:MAG: SDR family oxidoreductase [Pseudomonadota bacterium]